MDRETYEEEEHVRPVELNDLNKTQLILLAILLSFVVSIATGVVTVTLMERASPTTTQTINRVVQRTIETVAPNYDQGKTQTVIVKEDDLAVDAISKTRTHIFALYGDKEFKEDAGFVYSVGNGAFVGFIPVGDHTKSFFVKKDTASFEIVTTATSVFGYSLLMEKTPTPAAKNLPKETFAKDADIQVGQTVLVVADELLRKRLVQSVKETSDESGQKWHTVGLEADIPVTLIGAFVTNLDGASIGIVVPKGEAGTMIIGIDSVSAFLNSPQKQVSVPN